MNIVFATTQGLSGSTMIGRVMPLARHFAQQHDVTVLILREASATAGRASSTPGVDGETPGVFPARPAVVTRYVGTEPFSRTDAGKHRLRGVALIMNMLATARRTAGRLYLLKPDVIIVVKTLPHNVLGAYLHKKVLRASARIIIDIDDFELAANTVRSLKDRAAIHWAERAAVSIADRIVTATPFLTDHFEQLARRKKVPVTMISTGIENNYQLQTTNYKLGHTILYLGSLSIASGHRVDLLPEILSLVRKKIPDARLLLAGRGDDEQVLRREFSQRKLADAVTWQPQFSPSEIPRLLAAGRVLVDPIDGSIVARAKSSSRTLLAAAAGYPIVTSNIGIRPYFLPDALHNRFFAAPGDVAHYAENIVALLKDPLSDRDRELMRRRARAYLWPALAQAYLKLIVSQ